jgi:integrase
MKSITADKIKVTLTKNSKSCSIIMILSFGYKEASRTISSFKDLDGNQQPYLQLPKMVNKPARIATGLTIQQKDWDKKLKRPTVRSVEDALNKCKEKLAQDFNDMIREGVDITPNSIKNRYQGIVEGAVQVESIEQAHQEQDIWFYDWFQSLANGEIRDLDPDTYRRLKSYGNYILSFEAAARQGLIKCNGLKDGKMMSSCFTLETFNAFRDYIKYVDRSPLDNFDGYKVKVKVLQKNETRQEGNRKIQIPSFFSANTANKITSQLRNEAKEIMEATITEESLIPVYKCGYNEKSINKMKAVPRPNTKKELALEINDIIKMEQYVPEDPDQRSTRAIAFCMMKTGVRIGDVEKVLDYPFETMEKKNIKFRALKFRLSKKPHPWVCIPELEGLEQARAAAKGKYETRELFNKRLRKYCKDAGLDRMVSAPVEKANGVVVGEGKQYPLWKKMSSHKFRATFFTLFSELDISKSVINIIQGHAEQTRNSSQAYSQAELERTAAAFLISLNAQESLGTFEKKWSKFEKVQRILPSTGTDDVMY